MGTRPAKWWVYILRCDGYFLYTGVTTSVDRRLEEHRGVRPGGARFTRTRGRIELAYCLEVGDRSLACRIEYRIKKLSREHKERIIAESMTLTGLLSTLSLLTEPHTSIPSCK